MEDNNYEQKVMAVVAVVALVAILGICLVACNAESIQKKLEKADYTCTSYEAGKDDDGASIEWKVVAKKTVSTQITLQSPNLQTQTMQKNMNQACPPLLSAESNSL